MLSAIADRYFREPEGLRYHGLAVLYALLAYVLGFAGLFADNWIIRLGATVLLGHGMTIAAYMIHECAHNTVFRLNRHNARLGTALAWLCGASYGKYDDMRYKHFRHHVDNDDVVWFDYERFFREHPFVYRCTQVLEFFYIPAHDLLMHAVMALTSFVIPQRRDQRRHNLVSLVIRGGIFVTLLWFFPVVAILYAIAYMLMMTILRFMDGLQHDYPYTLNLFEGPVSPHKGDRAWEQEHTFSPVFSWRYEWPNWVVLNFGFHNAHHARPTTPWYKLPKLHRKLFGDDPSTVIALWPQLLMFHRHRTTRILHDDPNVPDVQGKAFLRAAQRGELDGGNAASFLTAF